MRKKLFVGLARLLCVLSFCMFFSACNVRKVDDVVLVAENVMEGQTLLSYMADCQEDGKITFSVQDGMVVKMNGVANTTKSFWMLYTTDTENANQSWGTYTHNGETLGSAMYGAESLIIKNGETYVWTYQTF